MGVDYLVNTSNLYLKDPNRDNIELSIEKAIGNYEESDKKEIDILAIGLKLFYNLDREVHVHRLYAIDRFVEYIANDTRKKTELNRDTIVEIILKRTIGQ